MIDDNSESIDFMVISEETYKSMSSEQREWIMFNTIRCLAQEIRKIKRQRISDRYLMVIGSAIGSALMLGGAIWAKIKIF